MHDRLRSMTRAAVMAAALCAVGPWTLSVGPVPFSLCTLLLYLLPYVTDWYWSASAVLVYLLLGLAGLPVFSAFGAGPGRLTGPSGGYLLGYIPLVLIWGLIREAAPEKRRVHFAGMLLATAVLYALGTLWFGWQTGSGFSASLKICVLPFIPGDCLKICAALFLGPLLRRRVL